MCSLPNPKRGPHRTAMRYRCVVALTALVLASCTSPTAPTRAITGPCWVHIPISHSGGRVMALHYATCPSVAELDATIGVGKYTVTPG